MGQMDGKVAIVTGSGRGIGREIALRLVRDGAKVVINDIDDAPAKETVAEIEKMDIDKIVRAMHRKAAALAGGAGCESPASPRRHLQYRSTVCVEEPARWVSPGRRDLEFGSWGSRGGRRGVCTLLP